MGPTLQSVDSHSDCGRPAWRVLPLPISHRRVVAQDAASCGIDAERSTRPLRDIAQMAQQHALRTFLDRLADGSPGADAFDEVRDVERRELIGATQGERIGA